MEKLGRQPDPDRAPIEDWEFPREVQEAFLLHTMLTDKWDGANGSYLGKDWSVLSTHFETYNITDRQQVTYFLKIIDGHNTRKVNNDLEKERKAKEKPVGTNVPSKITNNHGKIKK